MWKDRQKYLDYHRKRREMLDARFRSVGACIDCGLPAAPYWRCFKHRVRAAKSCRKSYRKKKKHDQLSRRT